MTAKEITQDYYDTFSKTYEAKRHHGYHVLLDELETDVVRTYCHGKLLEAGCGTGLILERLSNAGFQSLVGIDLSHGMLSYARRRGFNVLQGSVEHLPFPNESFDGVISFKVLAHVPNIRKAILEFSRVTKPDGHLVLEFYNRYSLRSLLKAVKLPSRIGGTFTDEDVFTRYDSLKEILDYLPRELELVETRGIRVVTPTAKIHDLPLIGSAFSTVERKLADHPLGKQLGGFLVVVLRKKG